MAEPRRGHAVVAIVVGVLMPLLLAEGVLQSVETTFDLGVHGTYVFGEQPSCDRGSWRCSSHTGTFTSDDGSVTRTVGLAGFLRPGFAESDSFAKGAVIRAFDVGDPEYVYSPEAPDGNPVGFFFWWYVMGLVLVVAGSLYLRRHRNHDQSGVFLA